MTTIKQMRERAMALGLNEKQFNALLKAWGAEVVDGLLDDLTAKRRKESDTSAVRYKALTSAELKSMSLKELQDHARQQSTALKKLITEIERDTAATIRENQQRKAAKATPPPVQKPSEPERVTGWLVE